MFLAKSNLALFAACGEASVFALVKSSLDCRHVCLLESVLLLAGCCERVFLHHGEDSPIIHHCCPPWTSRPFYVSELNVSSCAFFYSQNVPNCLIWPLLMFLLSLSDGDLFLKPNNHLFLLYGEILWPHDVVHSNSFQMQMTHLESTPEHLPA